MSVSLAKIRRATIWTRWPLTVYVMRMAQALMSLHALLELARLLGPQCYTLNGYLVPRPYHLCIFDALGCNRSDTCEHLPSTLNPKLQTLSPKHPKL